MTQGQGTWWGLGLIILMMSVLVAGCASRPSATASTTTKSWVGFTEKGKASYYGAKHQGKKTASGEPFKQELKTAAHKTIPFGAMVKVTNVDNEKSVVVRVNDRGPFVSGRIIDLSSSAFNEIGSTAKGVLKVEIEVIK
jgi:rare lipoprotein A